MRLFLITLLSCLAALSQVACGGGGGDDPSTPDLTPIAGTTARFATTNIDFGTAYAGGSVLRQVEVFNDGTAEADFSVLDNLGDAFTSRGCEKVAAGTSCWLNITMHGRSTGSKVATDVAPVRADSISNRLSLTGVVRSGSNSPCPYQLAPAAGPVTAQRAVQCP